MIVGVNVVPNRTVVVDKDRRFNNLWGSHLQRVNSSVQNRIGKLEGCHILLLWL